MADFAPLRGGMEGIAASDGIGSSWTLFTSGMK